jgi:hypothetical protein
MPSSFSGTVGSSVSAEMHGFYIYEKVAPSGEFGRFLYSTEFVNIEKVVFWPFRQSVPNKQHQPSGDDQHAMQFDRFEGFVTMRSTQRSLYCTIGKS